MNMPIFLTLSLGLAGCWSHGTAQPGSPSASMREPTMIPLRLPWRSVRVGATALTIDVVDGPEIIQGDFAALHVVSQVRKSMQLDVWTGREATLSWWRGRFVGQGATLAPPSAIELCGHPAQRQEVTVPAQEATGIAAGENGMEHVGSATEPEVHIGTAGVTRDGHPFVVSWRVSAARRAELRGDEKHFLSSIRCEP